MLAGLFLFWEVPSAFMQRSHFSSIIRAFAAVQQLTTVRIWRVPVKCHLDFFFFFGPLQFGPSLALVSDVMLKPSLFFLTTDKLGTWGCHVTRESEQSLSQLFLSAQRCRKGKQQQRIEGQLDQFQSTTVQLNIYIQPEPAVSFFSQTSTVIYSYNICESHTTQPLLKAF